MQNLYSAISVEPQALDLMNLGPTHIQLILSYSTFYNVSTTATIICGQSSSHFIGLQYSKPITLKFCGDLLRDILFNFVYR